MITEDLGSNKVFFVDEDHANDPELLTGWYWININVPKGPYVTEEEAMDACAEAQVKLIKAAPEMLEVLKEILAFKFGVETNQEPSAIWNRVTDVILKATK